MCQKILLYQKYKEVFPILDDHTGLAFLSFAPIHKKRLIFKKYLVLNNHAIGPLPYAMYFSSKQNGGHEDN